MHACIHVCEGWSQFGRQHLSKSNLEANEYRDLSDIKLLSFLIYICDACTYVYVNKKTPSCLSCFCSNPHRRFAAPLPVGSSPRASSPDIRSYTSGRTDIQTTQLIQNWRKTKLFALYNRVEWPGANQLLSLSLSLSLSLALSTS